MLRVLLPGLVTVVAASVVLVAAVMGSTMAPPAAAQGQACQATLGPTGAAGGGAQAGQLNQQQRDIAARIISIGQQRHLPPRAWQIALQAGMTESGLRNLAHGDRDSVGIFQMRASQGWGSPTQLSNVDYQITTFYQRLTQVSGWDTKRPGEAAQAVERSAFPSRYHRSEALAAELVASAGEVADPTGCGEDGAAGGEAAQQAIAAAKEFLGTPYAWGGGSADGPSAGTSPDRGVVGFDCSSLMLYAYAQAGITLPRTSTQQYHAGAHVPVEQAQPGDLLFWADTSGNPAAIHHVALYLGNDQVIQAPQSGDVIKISQVWHSELVPTATRPGGQTT